MILVAPQVVPSNAPASIASLPPCAPDRLARCFVSTPRDSLAMDVIGITCSSCADWWKPDLDGVYDPCRPNDRHGRQHRQQASPTTTRSPVQDNRRPVRPPPSATRSI